MTDLNDTQCWLALMRSPGVGVSTAHKLLSYYGSPRKIIHASNAMRQKSGIFPQPALDYFAKGDFSAINDDLKLIDMPDVDFIHINHPKYPLLLKEIHDPPIALFTRGDSDLLAMPQLAIVGSRSPDTLGKQTAFKFAKTLSNSGVVVTSGMALGVDAYAHMGALEGTAGTIAVLGTGVDTIYPAKNKALAHQIVKSGVLVSEFGANTSPRAHNFPIRNRIVSGLALGVLVIQAKAKSGSLITARTSMEQGREVFAVPGSINNPLAKGCHKLIKQGVKLVETTDDIFSELSGMLAYTKDSLSDKTLNASIDDSSNDRYKLLSFIEHNPIAIDALVSSSGMAMAQIASELSMLEIEGKIEILPGAMVQRL